MSRFHMCPVCGRRMRRNLDLFGDWDGESYICDNCYDPDYDDDCDDDYDDD